MYASEYPEEVDGIRSNEDAKATTWSRFLAPLALGGRKVEVNSSASARQRDRVDASCMGCGGRLCSYEGPSST
jgi:hypothetical protein